MEVAIIHFKLIKVFCLKNCYFRKHFFGELSFLQGEDKLVRKFKFKFKNQNQFLCIAYLKDTFRHKEL